MSLSKALEKVASKIVNKFGADVVVRYIKTAGYDANTGTVRPATNTDVPVSGVLENVALENVNQLIQIGDKRLILAAKDLPSAPTLKDVVIITGITYQIIQVDTIEPQQLDLVYEIILRA